MDLKEKGRLALSRRLVVLLTSTGLRVAGSTGWPIPLNLAGVHLLYRFAVDGGRSDASELVAEISVRYKVQVSTLETWCGVLEETGLLVPPSGAGVVIDEPMVTAPASVSADSHPLGRYVAEAPLVFRVSVRGFELLDHDARLRLRCLPNELDVLGVFHRPRSRAEGCAVHLANAGTAALSRPEFDAAIDRFRAAEVLRAADPDRSGWVGIQELGLGPSRIEEGNVRRVERLRERWRGSGDAEKPDDRPRVVPVSLDGPTLPLGLGLLMAHASQNGDGSLGRNYRLAPEWGVDRPRAEAIARGSPAVFLFSNYLWSTEHCLAISKAVKDVRPGHVTIHGGPSTPKYPSDCERFFLQNPHVDVTVRGEGEATLAGVLEALGDVIGEEHPDLRCLNDVPGVSFRVGETVVHTGPRERIAELDTIPSPYLTGLFADYADVPAHAMIVETNRGCPYGCTFCDWGSATLSRIRKFSLDRVCDELEWGARHGFERFQIADANFGIFARDVDIIEHIVSLKERYGYPVAVGMDFAKNTTKYLKTIIRTMVDAGIMTRGILALQSMDDRTLEAVHRKNIKIDKYDALGSEFRKANLPIHVDLMMGLPGQTVNSWRNDLQECVDREVGAILPATELLPNSPMNDPRYREKFEIKTESFGVRERVISTSTFTHRDYRRMATLRSAFLLFESFGVLRHVSRYVRHELGIEEMELYASIVDDAVARPEDWPILALVTELVPNIMAPPVSWRLLLSELGCYLTSVSGVPDDQALQTVLDVQHALLPTRRSTFPRVLQLPHDYATWYALMIEAKESGHRRDWVTKVPGLRTLGPSVLTIDDPAGVSEYCAGFTTESYGVPMDWELHSLVSRPSVVHPGYFNDSLGLDYREEWSDLPVLSKGRATSSPSNRRGAAGGPLDSHDDSPAFDRRGSNA